MTSLKLIYFDFSGRAEPCRLACAIGEIPLVEERIDFAEFASRKAKGEFPVDSLPCLVINGDTYCQSNSILRYIGKLTCLYPCNSLDALRVDQVLDTIEEVIGFTAPTMFMRSEEERKAARNQLVQNVYPKYARALDKWCEGGHVVKDTLTVADLAIHNIVHFLTRWHMMDHIPKDLFHIHAPNCVRVFDMVNSLPRVQEYQKRHCPKAQAQESELKNTKGETRADLSDDIRAFKDSKAEAKAQECRECKSESKVEELKNTKGESRFELNVPTQECKEGKGDVRDEALKNTKGESRVELNEDVRRAALCDKLKEAHNARGFFAN